MRDRHVNTLTHERHNKLNIMIFGFMKINNLNKLKKLVTKIYIIQVLYVRYTYRNTYYSQFYYTDLKKNANLF